MDINNYQEKEDLTSENSEGYESRYDLRLIVVGWGEKQAYYCGWWNALCHKREFISVFKTTDEGLEFKRILRMEKISAHPWFSWRRADFTSWILREER